ncbi:MAG: hypothetical protein AAF554_02365 [Bacteroidota bacterium]
MTEEVEAILKEMAAEYTKNQRANDMLQIAELVEQFRVNHPNNFLKLRQVLFGKHARVLGEFINQASK